MAVYVNAGNPVTELTYDEISGIYRGKLRNWKDLGGSDTPIVVLGSETNTPAGELFLDEVLAGKDFAMDVRFIAQAELLKGVARETNAVGFGAFVRAAEGTRALSIKRVFSSTPVEPSEEAISNRIYPISRFLYFYLNPASNQGPNQGVPGLDPRRSRPADGQASGLLSAAAQVAREPVTVPFLSRDSNLAGGRRTRGPASPSGSGFALAVAGSLLCLWLAAPGFVQATNGLPTLPKASNRDEFAASTAEVVFDHPSGFYQSAFPLVLTPPPSGTTVYYTTNGAAPPPRDRPSL